MAKYRGLFFEDLLDEKKEPNGDEKITFIYPWIFNINEIDYGDDNEDDAAHQQQRWFLSKSFGVHHKFGSLQCYTLIDFQTNCLAVESVLIENSSYSASYEIYADDDMRFKTYDSSTVNLSIHDHNYEIRSAAFLQRLRDAAQKYYERETNCRVVIYFKLQIPMNFFFQPYKYQRIGFGRKPGKLPVTDEENAFVYHFIPMSNFKIKCLDGEIPAIKMQLFVASLYFQKMVTTNLSIAEWTVNHNKDVVQPIITYIHSLCFEMPKVYDFSFAKRIPDVIDFLRPIHESDIKNVVFLSICEKVATEPPTFFSILQWLPLAIRPNSTFLLIHRYPYFYEGQKLYNMICTFIGTEFHMKWLRQFPRRSRTLHNPEYAKLVLPGAANANYLFTNIDGILKDICITNVILP